MSAVSEFWYQNCLSNNKTTGGFSQDGADKKEDQLLGCIKKGSKDDLTTNSIEEALHLIKW